MTISDLQNHALEAGRAGVFEHLAAVDLEALAELDIGFVDGLLEERLALDQRKLSQVVTIEVKQIERDHDDFGRPALQLVFQN
jgi:hypothetical protein